MMPKQIWNSFVSRRTLLTNLSMELDSLILHIQLMFSRWFKRQHQLLYYVAVKPHYVTNHVTVRGPYSYWHVKQANCWNVIIVRSSFDCYSRCRTLPSPDRDWRPTVPLALFIITEVVFKPQRHSAVWWRPPPQLWSATTACKFAFRSELGERYGTKQPKIISELLNRISPPTRSSLSLCCWPPL